MRGDADATRLPATSAMVGIGQLKVPRRACRHCAVGYLEALKRIDIR
jgi:hypothetical protein